MQKTSIEKQKVKQTIKTAVAFKCYVKPYRLSGGCLPARDSNTLGYCRKPAPGKGEVIA
jgi:hypothetical protein